MSSIHMSSIDTFSSYLNVADALELKWSTVLLKSFYFYPKAEQGAAGTINIECLKSFHQSLAETWPYALPSFLEMKTAILF